MKIDLGKNSAQKDYRILIGKFCALTTVIASLIGILYVQEYLSKEIENAAIVTTALLYICIQGVFIIELLPSDFNAATLRTIRRLTTIAVVIFSIILQILVSQAANFNTLYVVRQTLMMLVVLASLYSKDIYTLLLRFKSKVAKKKP